jgi:hypothetical protein
MKNTENTIIEKLDMEDILDLFGFEEDGNPQKDLNNLDEVGFNCGCLYLGNKKNWGIRIKTFYEYVRNLIETEPENEDYPKEEETRILDNGKTEHAFGYWSEDFQALYWFIYYTD